MKLILLLCLSFSLSVIGLSQNIVLLNDDSLNYDEKMSIGKAYIDESFPDCDLELIAPHSVISKQFANSNEQADAKNKWITEYKYEYDLLMYFLQKQNDVAKANSDKNGLKPNETINSEQNK